MMATYLKLEALFVVPDNPSDQLVLAESLTQHMRQFRDPNASRNAKTPHYESCKVSVERKTWDTVMDDRD